MKTISSEDQMDNNLVMFPSSKNFKAESENDPLYDLLNEYSHLEEEDIPGYLDQRFELPPFETYLESEGDAFDSLEAFMNRHERGEILTPDDKLVKLINERMNAIKEAKERIKYYLDEMEMFLPSRKK